MSVKELWKNIITPKLAIKIKKNFNSTSKFDINVEYVYTDDEKEYRFLLNKFPGKFKKNQISQTAVDKILRSTYRRWLFKDDFPCPPSVPNEVVKFQNVCIYHARIFCGGRYNKWSRNVSQARWHTQRNKEVIASVEEMITDVVKRAFGATKIKFVAAGREDVDVRCLGRGRPFYLDLFNPQVTKMTQEQLNAVQREINTASQELMRIRHLQLIDESVVSLLKEGAEYKKKSYCAYYSLAK